MTGDKLSAKSELSKAGKVLEQYKLALLRQPKITRNFLLPSISGLFLWFVENGSGTIGTITITMVMCLILWNTYNQYLESVTYEQELEKSIALKIDYSRLIGVVDRNTRLNEYFRLLVHDKSLLWLTSLSKLSTEGRENAREYIRNENSFDKNVSRIVSMLRQYFDDYADISCQQRVRVTFFKPSDDGSKLELVCWNNASNEPPTGTSTNSQYFEYGGSSLAATVWRSGHDGFQLIDDVEQYLDQHPRNASFTYLCESEKEDIKSIACFRVDDSYSETCLGVLCIDTNITGGLGEILLTNGTGDSTNSGYVDKLEEVLCKRIMESFAARIVFEMRFAAMKEAFIESSVN